MSPSLMSIKQTAEQLGVSAFGIRRLIASGCIKSVTIGARRLVPLEEVQRISRDGAGKPRPRRAASPT